MNKQLQEFARSEIKKGLALLPEKNRQMFKRMYSHNNLNANISDVVDAMTEDKLDWAMDQIRRTIQKNKP